MAISSPNNPNAAVNVEVIATEDDEWFLKGPTTQGQWMHFTKEQFEELNEGPEDASLYPMSFISSFFSTEKALTNSIDPSSIEDQGDDKIQGQSVDVYSVEISIPDYINFLSADEDNDEKDIEDANKILANAIVNAKVFVDKSTGYVIRLVINSENLTQIQTPETEPLGIESKHDTTTTVDLSRFNMPTNIKEPTDYIEYRSITNSESERSVLGAFN